LMSEGRERRWGVKYLTDKGGAMALEVLYLCKTRDVLEEQVCVCGGIDVTACAYLRVYVSVCIVCMLLISVCACMYVCMYVCADVFFTLQHVHMNIYLYIGEQTGHG
jgi:hypothetical protein